MRLLQIVALSTIMVTTKTIELIQTINRELLDYKVSRPADFQTKKHIILLQR